MPFLAAVAQTAQAVAPGTARLLGGLLFAGASLLCLGFAVAMAYEAVAVATGAIPTISGIAAGQILNHPVWSRVWIFGAGLLIGALIVHLSGWKP